MTWTFDPTSITTNLAKVRLLIGDTDTNDQQLTDEQIAFFLSEASNNIYGAAILACNSIASKYARLMNSRVESISVDAGERYKNYMAMATQLRRQQSTATITAIAPYVGGISLDAMAAIVSNTDRVEPAFRREQFSVNQNDE